MLAARRLLRPTALSAAAGAAAGGLAVASSTAWPWAATTAGCAAAAGAHSDPPPNTSARSFASSSGPSNPYPPPDASRGATADLCDVHVPSPVDTVAECPVQIMAAGVFRDYGGRLAFSGRATTVKCFEANPLVRACLEEDGRGRVLVVDGGGSKRCALLGDNIAAMAASHAWAGVIIHGCIRDSADIGAMDLGVKALATHPLKSAKRDAGLRDVAVSFAGVTIRPGDWVYADGDGVLVSPVELKL